MRRLRLRLWSRWKNPTTGKHEWHHQTEEQITNHMIEIFQKECTGKICCRMFSYEPTNIPGIIKFIKIQRTSEKQFVVTHIEWTNCNPEQEVIARLVSEGTHFNQSIILDTDYEIHHNTFKHDDNHITTSYLCLRATTGLGIETYRDYKAYFRARKVNDAKKAKQILS